MALVKLTDNNFQKEVLESKEPVLVEFWAKWCGPCRMMEKEIAGIETEIEKGIKIGKLNVDENPDTASVYNVMSIPTLILFDKGKETKRMVGMRGKEEILEQIRNSNIEIRNKSE